MKKKGFTLAELLIVVAIIAVLVAVSIPIFAAQLHKSKVAADWANVRSYFSEIQADYISTGVENSLVPDWRYDSYDNKTIKFLNGQEVKLDGIYGVIFEDGTGYAMYYYCSKYDTECELSLGS